MGSGERESPRRKTAVIRFGGITLMISGILFFAQYLFLMPVPKPPLADADLMRWVQDWRLNIAMADELLMFATLCLTPSVVALYMTLVKVDQIKAIIGCSLLFVTIPVYIFLDIILGRLVYPVYDIELSPAIHKLVLSTYHGGMHAVALILGAATIILSLAIRKSPIGKPVAHLGFVAGILDLVGAYPWLIGTAMQFLCQLSFAAWFVLLGLRMLALARLERGDPA